ncbi:MAG: S8 family serine peptidase [candidate division NC10 bacterium]|nr:S8 family serine peptidase [candidate division NC10 bacterium]
MFRFRYGGKRGKPHMLLESDQFVVVRTRSRRPLEASILSTEARRTLDQFKPVVRFPAAGVEVLRAGPKRDRRAVRDRARALLKRERDCQFVGRVLCDPKSGVPVLYTENFFVKFHDDCPARTCKRVLNAHGLVIKRALEYVRNAYFVAAPQGTGRRVFAMAARLLQNEQVELCHPELVREVRYRTAFPQQWHLKKTTIDGQQINAHAHVEEAWAISEAEGTVIAIIDDGVDLDHEEFGNPGKIIAPRDVTRGTNNPRPGAGDNHGTSCAGVACADGRSGASGAAPKARLLPIRLVSGLGSQAEADAFVWAAQNGADIISCSWGPADGNYWNPNDPRHQQVVPLPDATRLAIDWAVNNGRNGKGCVITWAAGNGNESVDNDGYASYEKVIAVAACNDTSKKSVYSDFGRAIWCAFPSNDFEAPKTPGIWTTDRSGADGYNPGETTQGDAEGNYTNSFGGTSSACPGAAGVAALVIARNPSLRWDEVKEILRRSCDKIDTAGGNYDANGHSRKYGYGRLNAKTAVALAVPPQPRYRAIHTAVRDVPIEDLKISKIAVAVGDTNPPKAVTIGVDIEHTFVGDLIVRILPPAGTGVGPVTLHDRAGGGTDNLKRTFDGVSTPALAAFAGTNPQGTWTLDVEDTAKDDTGKILSFSVELRF